jgi:hypothetical protein
MHELVAFKTNGLMKLKKAVHDVNDLDLKKLYFQTIEAIESNLRELLNFIPKHQIHPCRVKLNWKTLKQDLLLVIY